MRNLLYKLLACFLFCSASLLVGDEPFLEVAPLSGYVQSDGSPALPSGLPEYWVRFMEKRALGILGADDWHQVSDRQLVNRFSQSELMVGGAILYCPVGEIVDMHPIVFWIVHGTWAQNEPQYYSFTDEYFRSMVGFALELARRQKRPIEIVSYQWQAVDSHEARRKAGGDLRLIAECFYNSANGYGPHWAFGHSHGVNVILIASQETFFDSIISFGAPVMEELYSPLNVGCIYHFYSLGDPWQKAGSVDVRSFKKFFSSLGGGARAYSRQRGTYGLYNFRVMFDAVDPGHVSLRLLMPYLWEVIDTVKEHYYYHTHFNLNIVQALTQYESTFQASIRDRLELTDLLDVMTEDEITAEVVIRLKNELLYSRKQEEAFSWRYGGKRIGSSSVWWRRILANWLELSELILHNVPFLRSGAYHKFSLLKEAQ